MSYDDLTKALREHGIPFDAASLRTAFESQGPEASDWVRSYVSPDTMLSLDELELYNALQKSGRADTLAAALGTTDTSTSAPPPTLPLAGGDAELRAAIDELNRSTSAISRQTESLRQQQDALSRLVRQGVKGGEARAQMGERRNQVLQAERRRLADEVESLAQTLGFRIADLEQQHQDLSSGGGGGLVRLVEGLLGSDDKLLASLQKLGWELETEDPAEKEGVVKLREVCARLIKFTVETLRTRLDRVYLQALEKSSSSSSGRAGGGEDDVVAMQAELDELYAEILPVAQMSVEQQYLEPAVEALTGRSAANLSRSVEALDYVDACMDYLLAKSAALSSRVEEHQAHTTAAAALLDKAKAELADKVEQSPVLANKARTRAATVAGGFVPDPNASPVRVRRRDHPAAAHRRRSSGGAIAEPPLDVLFRNLALTLPSETANGGTAEDDLAALEITLAERTSKTADVARNVQAAFEEAASTRLADVAAGLAAVRDSVLAETAVARGDVAFVDPGIDASIGMLAQEVARVRARLEDAEAEIRGTGDGKAGALRSAKRDEFVKRWGPMA